MNQVIVNSNQSKRYCETLVSELPTDGSKTVVVKNTNQSITARQMRLRWMWMGEVATSGLGMDDTKEDVDIRAKWKYALPILRRDLPEEHYFIMLLNTFIEKYKNTPNYAEICRYFVGEHVSISKLLSKHQTAEYLTAFEQYWRDKGVGLTDPALQGLDMRLLSKPKKAA